MSLQITQPDQTLHVNICQMEEDEFYDWVTDIHKVRDAGPELLRILRKICAAETKPDLDMAITEGVTMVEKLPIL